MERWIALALIAAGAPAMAQVPAGAPATDMSATPPAPVDPVTGEDLSFLTADTRMTVPVRVAGEGPFPFVIDTGAQRSVISRQLARRLGLAAGPRVRLIAMSGTGEADTVIVPRLSVDTVAAGTLGGERIEAPAIDHALLGAPGMLGIDTLQGRRLAIDFVAERMTVTPSSAEGRTRRAAADEIVIQARNLYGQLVVTQASVAGRKVRVILDTGTSISIGNAALRRLLGKRDPIASETFTGVLGQPMTGDYAIVRAMTLGSATIQTLPVAFAEAAPFRAFGLADKPAILLGMDALRLFRRVEIDFARRELRLSMPRQATAAAF
ncbi:aspartyl protease family protein [uncultured Sphingomonas sp.]|uniref:aspartyl protease family protein n=1 Tax=uncultured Sphingomonas sp. TaxID=158754 RepID=UPI00258AC980|nr:aspartyl protease family protein [uncultured Sphingomonas sp.]